MKRNLAQNEKLNANLQAVEKDRNRQIDIIDKMAMKVTRGYYSARIDINDLRNDSNVYALQV